MPNWILILVLVFPAAAMSEPQTAEEIAARAYRSAQAGDLAAAEADFRRVVDLAPRNPVYLSDLASILRGRGKLEEATRYYREALGLVPGNVVILRNLALTQWDLGQLEEAKGTLDAVLKADPAEKLSILILGMIEERLNNYQDAARRLESVRDLVRQRPESIAALVRVYYKLGDPERARVVLADLNQEPAFLDLVRRLAVENEWRLVLEICHQGVQKIPTSGPLFEVKGLAETMLLHTADAIRSYSRALEINPKSARANLGLGTSQASAGMYAEAQETFARGIRDFPEDPLHYQEYGLLLVKLGQTGDAAQEAKGFELLERAVALNSNLAQANYHIGQAALERGDTDKAIAYLERARRTEPNVSKIRYALARAYGRLGKKEEAARELESYRRLKAEEERSSPGFPPDGRASKRPEE